MVYSYGSVTGNLVYEFDTGFFRVGYETGASVASESTLVGCMRQTGSPTISTEKVGLYGCAVGDSQSNYGAGLTYDSVGVLGQGFNEATSNGRVWGGVFEATVQSGTLGCAKGIEVNTTNANSANNASNLSDNPALCANIIMGGDGGASGAPNTALIWTNTSSQGWWYGVYLRDIRKEFLRMESPLNAGAVAINIPNNSNWGDIIHAPNVSRITRYDSTGTLNRNVISWSAANDVAIGETGDQLWLMTPAGQRTLQVGAPDSGGTGYRVLRVQN